MTHVLELKQTERIVIDSARLERLFSQMGDKAAEAYVMDTVEEISNRLFEIEHDHRMGALAAVVPRARRVARLCTDIGLTSLGRVARDLGISAHGGDMVAYRAVWEQPGLSI